MAVLDMAEVSVCDGVERNAVQKPLSMKCRGRREWEALMNTTMPVQRLRSGQASSYSQGSV